MATPDAQQIFEMVFASTPDAMMVLDPQGRVVHANRRAEALFGYPRLELAGALLEALIPHQFPDIRLWHQAGPVSSPPVPTGETDRELSGRRKDGSAFPVILTLSPIGEPPSDMILAVLREVVDRRTQDAQVRQSSALFELLFENTPDAIVVADRAGRIVRVNARAETLFQYSRQELVGMRVETLVPERLQDSHRARREDHRTGVHARPMGTGLVLSARRKDGVEVPVDIMLSPIEQGEERLTLAMVRDITERKIVEEQERMRAELQHKEVLIKEVHHRVKNNLQVISNLLALQELSTSDPATAAMFQDTQDRVKAMALLHEKLYRSSTSTEIGLRFDDYLRDLLESLAVSFNIGQRGVRFALDAMPFQMSLDTAVPCGLLINELVTNSLKHAFPDSREGIVTVSLETTQQAVTLTVRDNGVGMPQASGADGHLGMFLIQSLAAQVQGRFSVSTGRGTTTTITIPTHGAV